MSGARPDIGRRLSLPGQRFHCDTTENGTLVNGTFANLVNPGNEGVSFAWLVSLPVAPGQQGIFYTTMVDNEGLSNFAIFTLGAGNNFFGVDLHSDSSRQSGGAICIVPAGRRDASAESIRWLRRAATRRFPITWTLAMNKWSRRFFAASDVETPEPATSAMQGTALVAPAVGIRRRRRA